MTEPETTPAAQDTPSMKTKYQRFDVSQRVQHLVFMISFTLLGITGLAQKYASEPLGDATLRLFGGIEFSRGIHHISAIVMGVVSAYHVLDVFYRVWVFRTPLTMLPWIDDARHIFQDVMYYLGLRRQRAYYGRYNYAEKMEYLAVVWGTLLMGLTGFMMWNPIATARFLPGQAIPAAKAAHGGEAVLAVLAIILWHFYHVHLKKFNKSMFTGHLTREEMEHEHPAELAQIEAGELPPYPPAEEIHKRRRVFIPTAIVLSLAMGAGLVAFMTIEETAITTVPQGETVQSFAPLTPTPRPTLAPMPTPEAIVGISPNSWKGSIEGIFRNRCSTCHGVTSVGGLSVATYASALAGGNNGSGIVPGNPDASVIVQIQSLGNHPGQFSIDELNLLIDWIRAGAPEQ